MVKTKSPPPKCNSENECGHELGINNSQISQTALKTMNSPQQRNETKTAMFYFYILLAVHLGTIRVNNQLDAPS
jgi:hypothetical protein